MGDVLIGMGISDAFSKCVKRETAISLIRLAVNIFYRHSSFAVSHNACCQFTVPRMENNIAFDGAIGVSAGSAFGCNYKSNQAGSNGSASN